MHDRVVKYETGLPLGFHSVTGELVEFEEARQDPEILVPAASLSHSQRQTLAKTRIQLAEGWPEREFHPGGIVDRLRALTEVEIPGDIGDLLVETEVRVASWVLADIRREAANG